MNYKSQFYCNKFGNNNYFLNDTYIFLILEYISIKNRSSD